MATKNVGFFKVSFFMENCKHLVKSCATNFCVCNQELLIFYCKKKFLRYFSTRSHANVFSSSLLSLSAPSLQKDYL